MDFPAGRSHRLRGKAQVLRENLEEIHQLCQDALEDAVLMGCDEHQFREVLKELMEKLDNPYRNA
jgi:hypothetical protein